MSCHVYAVVTPWIRAAPAGGLQCFGKGRYVPFWPSDMLGSECVPSLPDTCIILSLPVLREIHAASSHAHTRTGSKATRQKAFECHLLACLRACPEPRKRIRNHREVELEGTCAGHRVQPPA